MFECRTEILGTYMSSYVRMVYVNYWVIIASSNFDVVLGVKDMIECGFLALTILANVMYKEEILAFLIENYIIL